MIRPIHLVSVHCNLSGVASAQVSGDLTYVDPVVPTEKEGHRAPSGSDAAFSRHVAINDVARAVIIEATLCTNRGIRCNVLSLCGHAADEKSHSQKSSH